MPCALLGLVPSVVVAPPASGADRIVGAARSVQGTFGGVATRAPGRMPPCAITVGGPAQPDRGHESTAASAKPLAAVPRVVKYTLTPSSAIADGPGRSGATMAGCLQSAMSHFRTAPSAL